MKKLIRIVVIIVVIFTSMIIFAVMNKVSDEKAFEGLKTAPISKLAPTGDLAEIFEFGGDTTDLQRENKMKAIKGSVVLWQLPVYEVKRDGEHFRVQTQNPNAFGNDAAMVPTIITLTSLSANDTQTIESLKTGDIISFKGVINDVSLRHLVINPAFLYKPQTSPSVETNAPVQKNTFPFVGIKEFNFMGGNGTVMSIEIKHDGATIVKSYNFEGAEFVEFDGYYQNPLKLNSGYEVLIENNKIFQQTNGKTDYGCKEEETPCESELYSDE